MILHFSAGGVPSNWNLNALYHMGYGIAYAAAEVWHERQGNPEVVVEVEGTTVKRSDMFWKPEHSARQHPDRTVWMQSPKLYNIPDETIAAVAEHVTQLLREKNFLIPRDEWERRYPASALIAQRFADFNAIPHDEIVWEPRWALMMQAPEGWVSEFVQTDDGHGVRPRDPLQPDPTGGHRWENPDDANYAMRTMNSGWSFEQALILMAEEPVAEPAPADSTDASPRI